MSEIMRPMSFEQLLNWTMTEYKENGTVFGERHPYHADSKFNRTIFGRDLETPIGPAADTEYYRSLLHRKPFLRAEDSSGNGRRRACSMHQQTMYQG